MPLSARHYSGRALVSIASSGIGGSNGHTLIEAPPHQNVPTALFENKPVLFAVGGLSLRSILALCDRITNNAPKCPKALAELAAISGRRARQMTWRSIALYSPDESTSPVFSFPTLAPRARSPLVFVFAGQGPQYFDSE